MTDDDLPSLWNAQIKLWLFLFKHIILHLRRSIARLTGIREMIIVLRARTAFTDF